MKVHGRRRVTVARRPNNLFRAGPEQPLLHANLRALPSLPRREARTTSEDANLLDGTCRATAVETAVTAAAALPTNSKMQLWQGCNNLVARVPVTSSMQLWAKPEGAGMADKADESMISRGIGVQLGCTKFSGKRSAEASIAQPSSKRWRIEAYTGPAVSSIGQQTSSCGTANAAGLIGVGSCSGAAWQKVAEGAMASFNHVGLSLRPSAAMSQQCDSVEES